MEPIYSPKGDPVPRALAAYFRAGGEVNQPIQAGVVEHEGKQYVVLHSNFDGVLAVYRIRTHGQLKRLVRWPQPIEEKDF